MVYMWEKKAPALVHLRYYLIWQNEKTKQNKTLVIKSPGRKYLVIFHTCFHSYTNSHLDMKASDL